MSFKGSIPLKSAPNPRPKKPYQPPRIMVFGNLAEMTKGTSKLHHSDMGTSKNTT
jgi:hypothetical protein